MGVMDINERLIASGVVPLVQAELPDTAVRISRVLLAGGLSVIEVVLRTEKKSASEINGFGDLESVPWQFGVTL